MEKIESENQNKIEEDDKIEIFEKYKKLSVDKKRLYCLYLIIIILIVQTALPYIIKTSSPIYISNGSGEYISYDVSSFKEIDADDLPSIASSSDTQLVYIGISGDVNCANFLPILKQAQEDYDYKTYYIDLNKVDEEGMNIILQYDTTDKFIEQSFGQVPMVITLKNGELVQGWIGYTENYDDFKEFLEMSGFKLSK